MASRVGVVLLGGQLTSGVEDSGRVGLGKDYHAVSVGNDDVPVDHEGRADPDLPVGTTPFAMRPPGDGAEAEDGQAQSADDIGVTMRTPEHASGHPAEHGVGRDLVTEAGAVPSTVVVNDENLIGTDVPERSSDVLGATGHVDAARTADEARSGDQRTQSRWTARPL